MTVRSGNRTRGYSLIEMVIYVGVLGVLTVAIVSGLVLLMRAYGALVVSERINRAATDVLERVSREVRASYGVNAAASSLGTPMGVLSLRQRDGNDVEHTVRIEGMHNGISIIFDGVSEGTLATNDVAIEHLTFYTESTELSTLVTIDLALTATYGSVTATELFSASVTTRGGY